MEKSRLPGEMKGEWVWSRRSLAALESFVFFRREFALPQTPNAAELWITARTFFNVFVNGRHVTFGPSPCPTHGSYVLNLDVAFLLETGANTIAVQAYNTRVSRWSTRRQPSGFWCQLNIDGKPAVWTDASWLMLPAPCYAENRPRRSVASGFSEKVDLRVYPAGWPGKESAPGRWQHVDHHVPLAEDAGTLVPLSLPELVSGRREFTKLTARGTCRHVHATTHASFAPVVDKRGPGVYAAETFVHAGHPSVADVEVYDDHPYRLFLNGRCIKEQGIIPVATAADLETCRPPCFRQADSADPAGEVAWEMAWNHVLLVQQCEPGGAGPTLVFPHHDPREFRPVRTRGDESAAGWSLYGPLRVPLANAVGAIDLHDQPKTAYVPAQGDPQDEGANLRSFAFEATAGHAALPEVLELRQGEYATIDLGQTVFGIPELTVAGSDDDLLDLVWGESVAAGVVPPCQTARNGTDCLILGTRPTHWLAGLPRGLRYLMLVARRAHGLITVRGAAVLTRQYSIENQGTFECSDRTLNEVWHTGQRTLVTTVQDTMLDSPCKDNAQYIADAMIQSWAGYHVLGGFRQAAKALEEFAHAQFETGEMPALCPSDVYLNMPDYALLWPVWLQRHFLYTGDHQLLTRLLPAMERLLGYYAHLGAPDHDVLVDLDRRVGAYCFLDHGDIDRGGMVTGLNAIYCRSLLSSAWLLERVRDTRGADLLRRRATHIAHTVRERCWDPQRGLFADGWHDGAMSEQYSWQSNVLAIYGGLATADQFGPIFDKLFSPQAPFELVSPGDTNNPFFKYFVLETAFALGRREWAVGYLRWYWSGMLARGATTWWELFNPDSRPDEIPEVSLCHGYGTSPCAYLCTELAGIRPAKPGFTQAFFHPILGAVKWAKAQVPTTYGRIVLEWHFLKSGELEAVIDANFPLEVVPMLDPAVAASAILHVSDDVTILAAPTA